MPYKVIRRRCWIGLLLSLWITKVELAASGTDATAAMLDEMLSSVNYDNRVRPFANQGDPVIVTVDMFINSISDIDEVKMEFNADLFLRQRWRDDRLTYTTPDETVTLNYKRYDSLWVPDLIIRNMKRGTFQTVSVPNRLLRLSPDGTVYYSQRLAMTLNCPFDLRFFPMDVQGCTIEMESYGYTTRDIVFQWRDIVHPVQVGNITLPEFELTDYNTDDCTSVYLTGSFSCQLANLHLVRQFHFYLIQTYIPTILVVLLSWVSFWIDIQAVPARISLALLTVLTMTTQSSAISRRLPRVSYIKAIDVWMTACLVFVFGGLIEYALVNFLARRTRVAMKELENKQKEEEERAKRNEGNDSVVSVKIEPDDKSTNSTATDDDRESPRPPSDQDNTPGLWKKMRNNPALAVDMVSRIVFPGIFVVFNAVYWSVYQVPRNSP